MILFERTGTRERLAAAYITADIFFKPTKEDSFPTEILEAEAYGTLVVTYDIGRCSETVYLRQSKVITAYLEAFADITAHKTGDACVHL